MSSAAVMSDVKPDDFGDRVSPILVKELRQGLKTKLFVSTFIVIQAAMVLLLGMRLLAYNSEGMDVAGGMLEGLLWMALGLMILIVMPLRGLNAISEEVKANTLDLVALTKLTSFRIVAGKWLALMAQTVLLTVAVLPYAVLRYFFGQVDIVGDLQTLALMLMASSATTALCVALSTAAPAFRLMVLLGMLMSSTTMMGGLMASRTLMASVSPGMSITVTVLLALFACVCYTLFFLLETTARIAPQAEVHPWARRLLPLVAFPVAGLAFALNGEELAMMLFFSFVPMITWAVVVGLTELPSTLVITYLPWEKRGLLGRLAGVVLHPGWPSAVVYATLVIFGGWLVLNLMGPSYDLHVIHPTLLLAAVTMPVLILLGFSRAKNRLGFYVLVQFLCLLWFVVAQMAERHVKDDMVLLVPTSAFLASVADMGNWRGGFDLVVALGGGVAGLVLFIVAVVTLRELRLVLQMHQRAAALLSKPATHD